MRILVVACALALAALVVGQLLRGPDTDVPGLTPGPDPLATPPTASAPLEAAAPRPEPQAHREPATPTIETDIDVMVTARGDRPLAGIEVHAIPLPTGQGITPAKARTGATGLAILTVVTPHEPGRFRVTANVGEPNPDYGTASALFDVAKGEPVHIELPKQACAVSVFVTDDTGAPVAGATVETAFSAGTHRTDAGGAVTIRGITAGETAVSLVALPEGAVHLADVTGVNHPVTAWPHHVARVDIVVPRSGAVALTLQPDPRGGEAAAAVATVSVYPRHEGVTGLPPPHQMRIGERHVFAGLMPGRHGVRVRFDGDTHYASASREVEVSPGATTELSIACIAYQGRLRGRVTDANGAAVVGAPVQVISARPGERLRRARPTTRDGSFELTGLPDVVRIHVDVRGIGYAHFAAFGTVEGAWLTVDTTRGQPMTLVLEPGYRIEGRVETEGLGLRHGRMLIEPGASGARGESRFTKKNGATTFAFEHLRAGRYRLWVQGREDEVMEVVLGPLATPGGTAHVTL